MWLISVFCLSILSASLLRKYRPWLLWSAAGWQFLNGLALASGSLSAEQSRQLTGYACVACLLGLAIVMNGLHQTVQRDQKQRKAARTLEAYLAVINKPDVISAKFITSALLTLAISVIAVGMALVRLP